MAEGDRGRPVFVALDADVLGRIARPDDEDVLALELVGAAEVMRVHDAARKLFQPLEIGNVGGREVARRHHDEIEGLGQHLVLDEILDRDGEELRLGVERDMPDGVAELHVFADVAALDPARDIIVQHGPRRVGRDGPAEMLLERVIGEFQAFLGAVGPEVAVHAAVHRLAIFVEAGPPRVVPEAAPVVLLFVADDLRDLGAEPPSRFEGPELGETAGTCTDDRNPHRRSSFIGHGSMVAGNRSHAPADPTRSCVAHKDDGASPSPAGGTASSTRGPRPRRPRA